MKKLLLVLLVVTLASFLFVGCVPVTPSEGEGEGEGEGECEVAVVIEGAVVVDGKTYVSAGNHDITVTFCAPVVGGVAAYISECSGYYGPDEMGRDKPNGYYDAVVLFPNAGRTVWSGSGFFGYCDDRSKDGPRCSPCCASYVEILTGECENEACIWFPVIVDLCPPYAEIEITAEADDCCDGCKIDFATFVDEFICEADEECCGDDCSGIASWSVVLYDEEPFDDCCDPSICEEPIGSCSGTACPIVCTTECLTEGETYYAVITLVDNVGLETVFYAKIELGDDCDIDVYPGWPGESPLVDCVDWNSETSDTVGDCAPGCLGSGPA